MTMKADNNLPPPTARWVIIAFTVAHLKAPQSSKIRVVECDSTGRVRDQNRGLLLSRRNSRAQFQELERKGKEERVYLEAFRQRLQEEKEQLAVKHAQLDAERERLRVTIEYQDEDRRKMWASLNEHMANVTAELRQQYEQQEAKLRVCVFTFCLYID